MEPVFTLSYSEFTVAKELLGHFKKNDGYSVSIPISRQQKGFDLLIYNQATKKTLTLQVKSSRTWEGSVPKRRPKFERLKHYTWFNRFDIKKGYADFYILFGVYTKTPSLKKLDNSRDASKWYDHVLLCLNESEMADLMAKITTRKGGRDDKFGFGFNDQSRVFLTRGAVDVPDISKHLFANKVAEMKKYLS